ncbi:hypothetical protein [Sediminispirochaeta smaragdinae]|jgi:hypothetical protein|uniref:Uncharacterized protein n=1 Tax=Sediminispirochaeta smaragdinae (strain DSM 11293 / JCM 15392 / SEBR 4228) TaxID=573413 RepID=E1RAP6_SEDSS|nr:hypothetical protein [Sediminispirochaeta smaragdinae]ADK82414.1 hypothetical protein Spirs_3318 [Sediminispirochaeta smaragdinae DSM 11293]
MYYAAYEKKTSKTKKWKIFSTKSDLLSHFEKIEPRAVPESKDVVELDQNLSSWSIAKLTPATRKKLEDHFEKPAAELNGKGDFLPDLVKKL